MKILAGLIALPVEIEQESLNALTIRDAAGDVVFEIITDADEVAPSDWTKAKAIVKAINEAKDAV